MLKIRLQRIGRRNSPAFRVVVTESTRGPKSGKNLEILGTYNPHSNTSVLKNERIKHWMDNGAQISDTVHNLFIKEKVIDGSTINVLPKKTPIVKEAEVANEDNIDTENKESVGVVEDSSEEGKKDGDSVQSEATKEEPTAEGEEGKKEVVSSEETSKEDLSDKKEA